MAQALSTKQWHCDLCGFVYDERVGLPNDGLVPGTPWDDVPGDWTCPDCSAPKADFTSGES